MRIAYVSTYDSGDIENWSGSPYFMSKALEQRCTELIRIGPLQQNGDNVLRAKEFVYRRVLRKRYYLSRAPRVLKSYADQVSAYLKDKGVDVVFSPGTLPISYLKCSAPIVFWTGCDRRRNHGSHPEFSGLCSESQRDLNFAEQAALSNCQLAIYSSEWAAQTAKANYRVDASKVTVVPFGANVEGVRALKDIRSTLAQKSKDVCKLLFIGTDWYRKGGDIAIDIARSLNASGLKTELSVVGCNIEGNVPYWVLPKGFISKKTSQGRNLINRLFAESHFLLVPSRADCVPVVIAEAASFGLPVVATDVGGVATAVRNNVNGYIFPIGGNFVTLASGAIMESIQNLSAYLPLAESSFGEYLGRLNWETAASQVFQLLQNILT